MKFPYTVKQLIDGHWQARSTAPVVGEVEVMGETKQRALDKLTAEIRYRSEWCPCSSVSDGFVELEVTEVPPSPMKRSAR